MSEYVVEITVKRMARGEGDVPILITAGSCATQSLSGSDDDKIAAIEGSLEKATAVVRAGLEVWKP